MRPRRPLLLLAPWVLASACLGEAPAGAGSSAAPLSLAAACLEPGAAPPPGALVCGASALLECGSRVDTVYVPASARGCAGAVYSVVAPGSWPLGVHDVTVYDHLALQCASRVTVVDRTAPTAAGRTASLWPPNHRLEAVRASDCVEARDACDPAPRAFFTWGAVDEPDDATGDGNTVDDLRFVGCDAAQVRVERRGNGDGRAYTFGVRVVDASGNASDAVCRVVVAHDQGHGGVVTASAPARRVPAPTGCR